MRSTPGKGKKTRSPGQVAQLVRTSSLYIHQSCRFDPWSGHTQEATNEYVNK